MPDSHLRTYINDHLAGATAGVELARRTAAGNQGEERFGPALSRICVEIEEDRAALEDVRRKLGLPPNRIKTTVAWLGEKAGRLKLNGHLRGYSPLSRLVELEGLYVGISGKARLWKTLESIAAERVPETDFHALAKRADAQRTEVEQLQEAAAKLALG